MADWQDTTSYQRDGDRTPTSWTVHCGGLRVVVHRHIHVPGKWLLSTYPEIFERSALVASDIATAKAEALQLLEGALEGIISELHRVQEIANG